MLKISKLKSGYAKQEILKGVDFGVGEKEIVAVIGPNGAGKSTLLKSIFGLCDVYSGGIIFKNQAELTGLRTDKLISLGIGFVPQGRQVFADMTVKENILAGLFSFQISNKAKEEKINKIFEFFPFLKKRLNERAGNFSGGQQQMLAIARALVAEPKLLLLDEPSLGLSPKMMKEIFAKIVNIRDNGVSIIIVEQNARQAVAIADRTVILENGSVRLEGGKEILESPEIRNIYFGGI